jgi:hypothetical protein
MTTATAEDGLRNADLPTVIAGCDLLACPADGMYDIQSRGRLGGQHVTLFRASGNTADIVGIGKFGWARTRFLDVPIEKHVDVFRALGFTEMVFPSGKRYEIRGWPGVRRVRD